jgi:hypothetical protein
MNRRLTIIGAFCKETETVEAAHGDEIIDLAKTNVVQRLLS